MKVQKQAIKYLKMRTLFRRNLYFLTRNNKTRSYVYHTHLYTHTHLPTCKTKSKVAGTPAMSPFLFTWFCTILFMHKPDRVLSCRRQMNARTKSRRWMHTTAN